MTTTTQIQTIKELNHKVGSLAVRGSQEPIKRNGSLNAYQSFEATPVIGTEFKDVQLSKLLHSEDSKRLIKDLAVLGGPRVPLFGVSSLS